MTYGLYIHIPFCIKKCAYCDFVSTCTPEEQQRAYFAALKRELKVCKGKQLDSIFLGGGTPSCVDARLIATLFDSINENMTVLPGAEITMEPGDARSRKAPHLPRLRRKPDQPRGAVFAGAGAARAWQDTQCTGGRLCGRTGAGGWV